MRRGMLDQAAAALAAGLALSALSWAPAGRDAGTPAPDPNRIGTSGAERMAREMNARNLVSVIYLGPRLADTIVEAAVMVLCAAGIAFIRERA